MDPSGPGVGTAKDEEGGGEGVGKATPWEEVRGGMKAGAEVFSEDGLGKVRLAMVGE